MNFRKIPDYLLILLLSVAAFGVYANSLHGDFLIDDQAGILNDQRIHDTKLYFSRHLSFTPGVLWDITRVFIWQISGDNPYYYHLFNVLINTGCVMLFFILCNVLFKDRALSFMSSLIFAIHPIHTEAVSWISGGPYSFSTLFYLAAVIFYLKSDKALYNLTLSVFFLALCFLSGNTVATLPLVFVFYDLFFREKAKEDRVPRRLRLLVLSLIFLVVFVYIARVFLGREKFINTIFYFRGTAYLIVVAKALAYYLKIMYLPIQRGLYHPFAYNTVDTARISPAFFVSLLSVFVSVVLFFWRRHKDRPLAFGIGFFFITYLPYSNLIPICNIISERYLYLPSAGFSLIIGYLILKVWRAINRFTAFRAILRCAAIAAVVLFLGSYTALTIKRNYEYSNILTYWQTNINNFPDGYMAYNNLAGTYYSMGNKDQAIAYCWVNLMINRNQPHVWCNLGKVYREKGNIEEAVYCYREALKIDQNYSPASRALEELKDIRKK